MTTLDPALVLIDSDPFGEAMQLLLVEARAHEAAKHPFLGRFASGGFRDHERVARQLCAELGGFVAWSLRYPSALLERLEQGPHRAALLRQLGLAHGELDEAACQALARVGIAPQSLQGVSHPELFRRLCGALEVEPSGQRAREPRRLEQNGGEPRGAEVASLVWRREVLKFLQSAPLAEAMGALTFGVMGVAKPIGKQVAAGLTNLGTLHRSDTVFFELPALLGGRDLTELMSIAASFARAPGGVAALRRGMQFTLSLCSDFLDHMYRCAVASPLAHPA